MKLKTFIKWMGNKSRYVKNILPYIPKEYDTYYEPFVGSGALFLHLQPKKWVINDLNKDLINCWKSVKNEPETIIEIFKGFGEVFKPMSKERKLEFCKNITASIDKMDYDIGRATIFMLMKYCVYMGIIIVKNKFHFHNLDMNIYINNKYHFLSDKNYNNFLSINTYLNKYSNGDILCTDYKNILKKTKKNDFVFLDPPYIEEHDYQFNYNKHEIINENFINELLKEIKILDKKGVKWLMTQADTKQIRNTFKEYKIKKFKVYRHSKKSYLYELIIMNF